MAQSTPPNLFELKGEGVSVTYSTSSFGGKPQLTYKKGRQSLSFSGDEIRTVDTDLGALVSVTIAKTVDRGFTTFSVVIPGINMAGARKQAFRTIGITTVHQTTIAGPVKGQLESSKVIPLRGSAQQVEFLSAGKAAGATA